MTSRVHRRVPALVLLGTVTLLAAGSFWLVQLSQQSAVKTTAQSERTEPDYFVENFTYSKKTNTYCEIYVDKLSYHAL